MSLTSFFYSIIQTISPTVRVDPSNPQENTVAQVGTWYCKMRRNHCWEAIGAAREIFEEEIRKEIKHDVESCCPEDGSMLSWSVFMIGRTRETAVPTILICSKNKKTRRMVRGLIVENKTLQKYSSPSFNIGDCSKPPDFHRVPQLKEILQTMASGSLSCGEDDKALQKCGHIVGFRTSNIESSTNSIKAGMHVFSWDPSSSIDQDLPKATIGTVFHFNGKYYATTVGHLFGNNDYVSEDLDDGDDGNAGFEFDIEGEFDESNDSDSCIDLEDASEICLAGDSSNCDFQPDRFSTAAFSNTFPYSDQRSIDSKDIPQESQLPMLRLGQVVFTTLLGPNSELDFAVIEIDAPHLNSTSATEWKQDIIDFSQLARMVSLKPKDVQVKAATGSAGVLSGKMSATSSFLRGPWERKFQEVWTVRFDKSLAKGDCGSMVVDASTNQIYGYIVAGTPVSGVAYIVPACEAFTSIGKVLVSGLEGETDLISEGNRSHSSQYSVSSETSHVIYKKHSQPEDLYDYDVRRKAYMDLDSHRNRLVVYVTAALSFFSDSYNVSF
jgi:hypothetical protein